MRAEEYYKLKVRPMEASKALAIDRANAEAHLDLAIVEATFDWGRVEAEREFRRGIELDPTVEGGRPTYALFLAHMGRFDEALDQIAAFERGPVGIQSVYASILYLSHQRQRTIEYCKCHWDSRRTPKDCSSGSVELTLTNYDRPKQSRSSKRRARPIGRTHGIWRPELAKKHYVSPASVAIAYMGLSDFDNAFAWLDQACFEHDFALSSLKAEPVHDPLRSNPRFQTLLHRVNLD
jgi:hypothetical protein